MIRLIVYSVALSALINLIMGFISIFILKDSPRHELLSAIILFIITTPLIYLLLRKILKSETEYRILKEKGELIRLSTEHAILYELSDQFLKTYDRAKIMATAVEIIHEYFNADFVKLLMPDEKKEQLILVSGVGWMPGYVGKARVSTDIRNQAGYTLLKKRPVIVTDFTKEKHFEASELLIRHDVKSGISVPMIATGIDGEHVIGVIGVHYKKPREFISKDLWFLTLIANETAVAIEKARLNDEIKASRDFLNSVLEGIGEGVIILDRDFRIVAANSAYINQERSEEMVIGKHCYSISHHSEKACHELGHDCPVLKTFETGEPASGIHTHYNSKGSAFYTEVHSYPLRDSSGNITMVVETITDVTERHELEKRLIESEERYRDLYENAPDMYCSFSNIAIIIECNNTMAKTLGYKKEELIGKPLTLLFSNITSEEFNKIVEEPKMVRSLHNIETQWRTKGGEIIDIILDITAFYNKDGSYISARASARDITEKKAVDRELKKKVKELEDFYNMAVDRESKMIELKKEIERLKEHIVWVPKDE